MNIYDRILADFHDRTSKDNTLKQFNNDLGVTSILKSIAFAVEQNNLEYKASMAELINPRTEKMLLFRLMSENLNLWFQKPLVVRFDIKALEDIHVPKNEKLTGGANAFILENEIIASKGEVVTATASMAQTRTIKYVANNDKYQKVKIGATYRELYKTESFVDGVQLLYSQCFSMFGSRVTYEVDVNGELHVVYKDLKFGDEVTLNVYVSYATLKTPTKISFISYQGEIEINNLLLESSYKQFMTTKDMRNIIKYERTPIDSLITEKDYASLVFAIARPKKCKVAFNGDTINVSYYPSSDNMNSEIVKEVKMRSEKKVTFTPYRIREVVLEIEVEADELAIEEVVNIKKDLTDIYSIDKKLTSKLIYDCFSNRKSNFDSLSIVSLPSNYKENDLLILNIKDIKIWKKEIK